MAFGDDHTVWLEVMKHLKSNLDLYMVSQCNKKLNGLGWFSDMSFSFSQVNLVIVHDSWTISKSDQANQHAVHVLKVRTNSKIDINDEVTSDEISPIMKLMHHEKEENFKRKNSLDSFRFWYKVWE